MGFWPVVKKVVKESDVVLIILDARMPGLSRNKEVKRLIRRYKREKIIVFNKIDLVSNSFLNKLRKEYEDAYFVSGIKNKGISKLRRGLQILRKRLKLNKLRVGLVGYPNVGKSAIINALARRGSAKVSRIAGTTRGIQFIRVGDILILDSPGVVPYSDSELTLGILGAKNPEKLKKPYKIVIEILNVILRWDKKSLEDFYKVKLPEDISADKALEEIAKQKGYLKKGGLIDEDRVILKIIRDWQSGKLKA